LAKRFGCWDPEVSVIDCGSKNNLVSYIGLLNQFRIPYLVVHDEDPVPDPVPDDWKEDRAKQARRTYAENARIASFVDHSLGSVEVLSPCFEEAAGVSKSQGEKVGKAMAAMESLADRDVPVCLQAIVRLAFASPKAGVEGQGRDAAVSA
jgi:CRISPR-associated exonuclease Cas4